jgi:peptidyl-prolyl cis-trans isomerase SurA
MRRKNCQPGDFRLPLACRKQRLRSLPAFGIAAGLLSLTVALSGCQRAPSPEVVATVNGKEIVASEVDRAYKQSLDASAPVPAKEEAAIHRITILHQLIQDEIMQQRAAKLNLVATDEEVDAKLTDFKAPYTQEEFDKQLKDRNQTLDDLRRDIRHQLTQSKLVNKEIESKINITDAEISTYFNAHKSEFNLIEPQYHLARIVVTNQPSQQVTNLQNNKANNDVEAKKKIQSMRTHLDAGEDFASLAARFSEDSSSSSNGGDSGFVMESQLKSDPEVFAAIGKLKAGQSTDVLPIVQGEGNSKKTVGYAIYQLMEKRPAGQRDMSDPRVQQGIRQLLRNNHAQLLQDAYLEMLYNDAKIHNYLAEEIYKNGAN